MPRTKTIAFFAENNTHTSTAYFHVYVFCEPLRDLGYDLRVYPILPDFLFDLWLRAKGGSSLGDKLARHTMAIALIPIFRLWQVFLATLQGVDGYGMARCLVQMNTFPWIEKLIGRLARKRKVPFVLFYPDALHLHHEAIYTRRFQAATHVVSVTPWLSAEVNRLGYSTGCVRASIVCSRYPVADQTRVPLTIGFSGGPGNGEALLALEPVLIEVKRRRPDVQIKIVGKSPPQFKASFPFEFESWGNDDPFASPYEPGVEEMLDFQIGLAPITVDEYAMGKDSVKLRQYMALGLAIVGTNYGVNREVLHPEENGLLADTVDEWIEAILRLIDDQSLREKLSKRARVDVERLFDVSVQAPILVAELDKAMAQCEKPLI